mmetsp:Transcript_28366/g.67269  ORF Transcript_28366/g.67269 Transcript_28366/m.67269 type:complete len:85 (+) Transcript_28366:31-285(+)
MYLKKRKTPKDENYTVMISARNKIKQLVREVAGLSPYEKHIEALLKVGRDKKALKLAKKRLGNIKRAKKKREILNHFLRTKKSF